MIINTKHSLEGKVVTVTLMNGQEILADLEKVDGDNWTFYRPVVLMMIPNGDGTGSVTFTPFGLGLDEKPRITINMAKMLYEPVAARDDAAKRYVSAFSGIQVVSSL
jgi:hypothetical protein